MLSHGQVFPHYFTFNKNKYLFWENKILFNQSCVFCHSLDGLVLLLDGVGQVQGEHHPHQLHDEWIRHEYLLVRSQLTWTNPIPIPSPPTAPIFFFIFKLKISRQPSVLIFIAAWKYSNCNERGSAHARVSHLLCRKCKHSATTADNIREAAGIRNIRARGECYVGPVLVLLGTTAVKLE